MTENTGGEPYILTAKDTNGQTWYWRELSDNEAIINLPSHSGLIKLDTSSGNIVSTLIGDLKPPVIPYLYEPETKRPYQLSDIVFKENYSIKSPARMFTDKPIVEWNPNLLKRYPKPIQKFIMWHEIGHNFFDDEQKADTWATITFLNEGWCLSSAIYALTKVLGKSSENINRMLFQNELLKKLSALYYA